MGKLFNRSLNGVHVEHHKNTADKKAVKMSIPKQVTLPMIQHMGGESVVLVKVGDEVKVGQKIGEGQGFLCADVHSSVSGTVKSIIDYLTPAGVTCKAVVIETDGLQTVSETVVKPEIKNQKDLIEAARNCGLVGLGGAGFPTHIKLNPKNIDAVDTLVVNGAECEPYITCDTRLMIDNAELLIQGIKLVVKHLNLKEAIIGIENNKPEAIEKLTNLLKDEPNINVKTLKSQYPQGGEKVLAFECTGRVIKEGALPADSGVIICNVTTLAKLADYANTGMPLVEKTLTVDGSAIKNPQNITVPLGTSIYDLVEFCGGYVDTPKKILMGGPMMGIALPSDEYMVIKNTNAILAFLPKDAEIFEETACIRCGRCMRACPIDLSPAMLDSAYHTNNIEALKNLKVNLCMECGCCSYVCPARRPLAMYNKLGKQLLRQQQQK